MKKANQEIRNKLKAKGIRQWQLAEKLQKRDIDLVIELRKELDEKIKQQYLKIIDQLEKIE